MSDDQDFEDEDEVGAEGNRIIGGRAKAVVEHVTRSIADEPDAVDVEMIERRGEVSILVHADKGDMGRLIGRRGRVGAGAASGDACRRARPRTSGRRSTSSSSDPRTVFPGRARRR